MNLKELIEKIQEKNPPRKGHLDRVASYAVACGYECGISAKELVYLRILASTYANPNDIPLPVMDPRMSECILAAVMFDCTKSLDSQLLLYPTIEAFNKIEPLIQPVELD